MEASTSRRRRSSESTATKGNGTSKSKSTAKTGKVVVEMSEYDRETPNTFRFQEDLPKGKERGDVGSLYCLKSALEKAGIDPDAGVLVTITQLPDDE